MDDHGTRVYLTSGGHVDVMQLPWAVAFMLWGTYRSECRPGDTAADVADSGTAGLVGEDGTGHDLTPADVASIAAIPR